MLGRLLIASALAVAIIVPGALSGGAADPRGQVTEFPVNVGPTNTLDAITAGPDGNLWFTEFRANNVARIGPGCVAAPSPVPLGPRFTG